MNWKNKVNAITPFVATIIFAVLWLEFDLAHPGWLVFLSIPAMPFILGQKKISISVAIVVLYLLVSIFSKRWDISWVILLLIPIVNILMLPNEKEVRDRKNFFKRKFFNYDEDDNDE